MAEEKINSLMVRCLECDSRIYFRSTPEIGQLIICDECRAHLEIVRLRPLTCGWANEEIDNPDLER